MILSLLELHPTFQSIFIRRCGFYVYKLLDFTKQIIINRPHEVQLKIFVSVKIITA